MTSLMNLPLRNDRVYKSNPVSRIIIPLPNLRAHNPAPAGSSFNTHLVTEFTAMLRISSSICWDSYHADALSRPEPVGAVPWGQQLKSVTVRAIIDMAWLLQPWIRTFPRPRPNH